MTDNQISKNDDFPADLSDRSMNALATMINGAQRDIDDGIRIIRDRRRANIESARKAGLALEEVKRRVGHGKWLPWIEQNCRLQKSQVALYRKIAANWDLVEANFRSGGNLSIRDTVALIDDQRPSKKRSTKKTDATVDAETTTAEASNESVHTADEPDTIDAVSHSVRTADSDPVESSVLTDAFAPNVLPVPEPVSEYEPEPESVDAWDDGYDDDPPRPEIESEDWESIANWMRHQNAARLAIQAVEQCESNVYFECLTADDRETRFVLEPNGDSIRGERLYRVHVDQWLGAVGKSLAGQPVLASLFVPALFSRIGAVDFTYFETDETEPREAQISRVC